MKDSKGLLFCTVVFPQNERFLKDFFCSVYKQDTNEFDFLIVNEGVDVLNYGPLPANSIIIESKGSPVSNRIQTIEYAKAYGYRYIIWQDSDDICLESRVSAIMDSIGDSDLLVHDMSIIDIDGKCMDGSFIGNQFVGRPIMMNDVKYLNFVGFGNMALKTACLSMLPQIPESIIAIDWWIVSNLLLCGADAVYKPLVLSAYRQYGSNIGALDYKIMGTFRAQLDIVYRHYRYLIENGTVFGKTDGDVVQHFSKLSVIHTQMDDLELLSQDRFRDILEGNSSSHKYLWWEKTNKLVMEAKIDGEAKI